MRIREEDIPKTAIRTRYGSFERRVLCFGLMHAPANFYRLLTTIIVDSSLVKHNAERFEW